MGGDILDRTKVGVLYIKKMPEARHSVNGSRPAIPALKQEDLHFCRGQLELHSSILWGGGGRE
jgi:hypothetical protein